MIKIPKPTKEDADLILKIFSAAVNDELYQNAFRWFMIEFNETNFDKFIKENPIGSQGYRYFSRVLTYTELVSTFVVAEVLSEDLVYDMWADMQWKKAEPIVKGLQKQLGMPRLYENFEVVAKKYPEWAEKHPPKV